MRRFWSIIWCS